MVLPDGPSPPRPLISAGLPQSPRLSSTQGGSDTLPVSTAPALFPVSRDATLSGRVTPRPLIHMVPPLSLSTGFHPRGSPDQVTEEQAVVIFIVPASPSVWIRALRGYKWLVALQVNSPGKVSRRPVQGGGCGGQEGERVPPLAGCTAAIN
ncbi:unnamed protein product [Lota lota]